MNILADKNVLNLLLDEKQFNKEFKAMLNEMIDEELKKDIDRMDCDLIEECTDMLIELEQQGDNGFPVLIPLTTGKKIINACSNRNFKSLSRGMRASIVACVILLSAISCNAAVYKISGHNIAKEVVETINQKLNDWGIVATAETDDQPYEEVTLKRRIEDINDGRNEEGSTALSSTTQKSETEQITKKPVGVKSISSDRKNETTTRKIGIEDIDGGWDEDETTTKHIGIEDIDGGWDDDETTKPIKPSTRQFTVTFDADGGTCDIETKKMEYRKPVGALPVPVKPGYAFAGWFNIDIAYKYKSQFQGTINIKEAVPITPEHIYTLEKDAVFTAKWVEMFEVTFDPNGGECDVTALYTDGNGNIKDIPVPVREGYIFTGWTCKMKTNSIPPYKTVTLTPNLVIKENMTFKADWAEMREDYTVTFNANGGSCDTVYRSFGYGKPMGELPIPEKEGYQFIGWFDRISLPANKYTAETVFETRKDIILYALWTTDEYILSFEPCGGECELESMPIYYGHNYGTLPVPTKPGCKFDGWYYGGKKVTAIDKVPDLSKTGKMTLSAMWSRIAIAIEFNGNGGAANAVPKKYYYGEKYSALPTAYLDGYRFLGWYTAPEGGEEITAESIVTFPYEGTLYAHWEEFDENEVVVTVHSNRSVESVYDLTYNYGDTLGALPIPESTTGTERSFTEFIGWYDDAFYGNKLSEDMIITENMDIYAHWQLSGAMKTKISIYNIKDYYKVDEAFNYNELKVKATTVVAELPLQDVIDEEGAENFYFSIDTSTPGWHTGVFRFSKREFDLAGAGTISFEKEFQYFVTDCEHTEGTHIENYIAPTCSVNGSTGDTVCNGCGVILEHGKAIPKLNHAKTEIRNVRPATCGSYGNTGDEVCVACGAIIKAGNRIEKLPHAESIFVNAKEATCTEDGYTGDYCCSDCKTVLSKGKAIPKTGHSEKVVVERAEMGKDGHVGTICTRCGEMVSGNYYPAIGSVALDETEYIYNNRQFTPIVMIKDANGNSINSEYYDIEMPAGRTEVGTYTVRVTFKLYYKGSYNLTFNIRERAVGGIISAQKVSRGIKTEWMAVEGADGYQIQVVSGDIVLKDLHFGRNITSQTIYMNVTNNVYVMVRSYKTETVNGVETKIYTAWSDKFYVS